MFGYSIRRPVRVGQLPNNAYHIGHPHDTNCTKNTLYNQNTHYAYNTSGRFTTTMGTTESLETCSYLCISSEPTATTCLSVVPATDRPKLTVSTLVHAL